jgi:hypothetical protein
MIRRTMEPLKVLACHSVEKRCTRQNASCAMAAMIRRVSRMMPAHGNQRGAQRHDRRERGKRRLPRCIAVNFEKPRCIDQAAGVDRHQHVGDGGADHDGCSAGDRPWLAPPGEERHIAERPRALVRLMDRRWFTAAAR